MFTTRAFAHKPNYIPSILREIIERTHPEGITDNSWSGLGRESICYCQNCISKFKQRTGKRIPGAKNWDDPVYREWIEWSKSTQGVPPQSGH